jgi:hypothetical protein
MITAAAMTAYQVAGRATRDALFLSNYPVTALPGMLVAAAVVSVILALVAASWLARRGPGRIMPVAFAASTVLLLVEWWLTSRAPHVGAVAVFLHMGAVTPVLVSGFWSWVGERFDPRTARRYIGRIGTYAAIGGIAGGLLAERAATRFDVATMLPALAALNAMCGAWVRGLHSGASPSAAAEDLQVSSGLRLLGTVPYLRNLALVVVLAALSAALLDYVFKARATAAFAEGGQLLRLFSAFYTAIALLSFVAQALLTRPFLERAGLSRTVATLPASVVVGGVAALFVPGLVAAAVARGIESILRNSIFRSAYELLFTPLPPDERRSTKSIIDVGFDRLGEGLGGALVALCLLAGALASQSLMLALAALLAAAALVVAARLQTGYVHALERSLLRGASTLDLSRLNDNTTRGALLETMGGVDLSRTLLGASGIITRSELAGVSETEAAGGTGAGQGQADDVVRRIADLRSRDPARIRAVLSDEPALSPDLVPHILPHLASEALGIHALLALRSLAPRATGQLIDALLDPSQDLTVRRRLPRVLVQGDPARVVAGLLLGLRDTSFAVRYQCGRVLARIRDRAPELAPSEAEVVAAVLREVGVERQVWEAQGDLERSEERPEPGLVDEFLRKRASRSLEHVFTLLALVLPRDPIKTAFQGLLTGDPHLRGMALEYLESVLPDPVREKLWPFLEVRRAPARPARSREAVLADLMRSNASIQLRLEELRRLDPGTG